MASYFTLTLDTTAPANPSIVIESGSTYTATQLVNVALGTSDADTTGYQMKIWGDVDLVHNTDIQGAEVDSTWITYQTTMQVQLSETNESKTLYVKIRDNVHNVSAQASDSIILDTTQPTVTISGPDVNVISKIAGKNVSSFSFQVDQDFEEYKVKVVGTEGAGHDTGTTIPTTAGSTNMTGAVGSYASATPIDCQITGTDLETASTGDEAKIIKVFVKDAAGNWSA